ncbi:Aste57867_8761 [Aphanomyces stellatus]|uniref:Aste57867_8761 protein n=1 Tax=Aphanomyces stellatus TaxID=120398 RepID=A0A485KL28_9STRA|nr:hypothetical protein As57867_008727 [Aphanomyces stellatus]VFT85647.1 Aste57867_8761 [Aphanomyces stellatus]
MRARTKSVSSMHEYFEDSEGGSSAMLDEMRASDLRSSGASSRSSSLSLWEDCDDWMADVARVRRCSHSKRISFDDDVKIETIPTIDEETKKELWYSSDEYMKMQKSERK